MTPQHLTRPLVLLCFRQRSWLWAKQTLLDFNLPTGCESSGMEKEPTLSLSPRGRCKPRPWRKDCRWGETVEHLQPVPLALSHAWWLFSFSTPPLAPSFSPHGTQKNESHRKRLSPSLNLLTNLHLLYQRIPRVECWQRSV